MSDDNHIGLLALGFIVIAVAVCIIVLSLDGCKNERAQMAEKDGHNPTFLDGMVIFPPFSHPILSKELRNS